MKISLKKMILVFFIMTYGLKSVTDAVYVANDINSKIVSLKYITMMVGSILSALELHHRRSISRVMQKDFFDIIILGMLFAIISIILELISNKYCDFSELIKLVGAPLYAYLLINTLEQEDFFIAMKWILMFGLIGYFLEVGTDAFTISNIKTINYIESYSPFESSYFAGTSVTCASYFIFFNKEKKYILLSVLFTLLTFKRLSIIFVLSLCLVRVFIDVNKKINKNAKYWEIIIFFALTYLFMFLLADEHRLIFKAIFNNTPEALTMGRSIRYNHLINNGFISYGFGSTTNALGLNLELDLIKVALEMSAPGLILLLYAYIKIGHENLYCHFIMIYAMFNLLTSHSLSGIFTWTLRFLIIGFIIYKNDYSLTTPAEIPFLKIIFSKRIIE